VEGACSIIREGKTSMIRLTCNRNGTRHADVDQSLMTLVQAGKIKPETRLESDGPIVV